MENTKRIGSCHCGAVRFEISAGPLTNGSRCNCTACTKIGQTGLILKPAAFRLLAGEEHLGAYEWGMKVSRRYFCKGCGVHCFAKGYIPELGGDYVSVNLNTIDDLDVGSLTLAYWDGRHDNWQSGTRLTPWPISA